MGRRTVLTRPETPQHPVDELLPPGRMATVALQHVASMYAGVAAPPLIIGAAAGLAPAQLTTLLAASLFIAGIATLLQTLGIWGSARDCRSSTASPSPRSRRSSP